MDDIQFAQSCGTGEDCHNPEASVGVAGSWDLLIPIILAALSRCLELRGKPPVQQHKWIEQHPRRARRAIIVTARQNDVSRLEAERLADRMLEEFEGLSDNEFAGIVTSLSAGAAA